jgi:lipoic acid synthetase
MATERLAKPKWLRMNANFGTGYRRVRNLLQEHGLHSVCQEASCPNMGECFESGTATFLILGHVCTRGCGFCDILKGKPKIHDLGEPQRLASAVAKLGLKHVVITSVTRDDLEDGGAFIFSQTVAKLREYDPNIQIELLIPDFAGSKRSVDMILDAAPEIFNHNIETVPRLYNVVRPKMGYRRSLSILRYAKGSGKVKLVKSGIFVGVGERDEEIKQTMQDIRNHGVDILTVGQYLSPSELHLPVTKFYHPDEFAKFKMWGDEMGFRHTESGPLVRSSYKASHQSSNLI